jgi:hypothetical protein
MKMKVRVLKHSEDYFSLFKATKIAVNIKIGRPLLTAKGHWKWKTIIIKMRLYYTAALVNFRPEMQKVQLNWIKKRLAYNKYQHYKFDRY